MNGEKQHLVKWFGYPKVDKSAWYSEDSEAVQILKEERKI